MCIPRGSLYQIALEACIISLYLLYSDLLLEITDKKVTLSFLLLIISCPRLEKLVY